MGYKRVDTTADIALEIWGKDYRELVEEAIKGLIEIMFDVGKVEEKEEFPVVVTGFDREDVLIAALNEVVFLVDARKMVFKRVEVHEASDTEVRFTLFGERYDPQRHEIKEEIKAATFHNVEIVEENNQLKTRIVFDV